MSKHVYTVDYQIGDQTVLLKVAFNFSAGRPATGPTYACGGTPAEPAEVDITSLEWARDNKITRTYEWHKIEGALFDFIAEDEYLHIELCYRIEDGAEDAADRRYEMDREDRALSLSRPARGDAT